MIRRFEERDLSRMKRLRLAALADSPNAFLARLADEEAMPAARWRERVTSNAAGVDTVGFFAVLDGRERGLVVGVRHDADHVELVSLWVEPEARGRGAGRALVEAVCDWARERGAQRVSLCVIDANESATALYRACGFEQTGKCSPFPHQPGLSQLEMIKRL